jgi:hypothetical protein
MNKLFKKIFIPLVFSLVAFSGVAHAAFTVFQGGTGRDTLTSNRILVGNGGSAVQLVTVGSGLSLSAGTLSATSSGVSLIGSTSGLLSNPTPGSSSETWLGANAGIGGSNVGTVSIGGSAGFGNTGSDYAVSLGFGAGTSATGSYQTINLGPGTGQSAINSVNNVFIGSIAAAYTNGIFDSIFIGHNTGTSNIGPSTPIHAANSIFIGANAGLDDTVDNRTNDVGSILIGAWTNTGGFTNSILIGNGDFATGVAISNTKNNQFMIAPGIRYTQWRGIDYEFPTAQAAGSNYALVNDGTGILSWAPSSGLTIQTNGTNNGSQSLLNLAAGTGITLTDNGTGTVTIDSSGSGGTTIYTGDGTVSGPRIVSYGDNLWFFDSATNKTGLYLSPGTLTSTLGDVSGGTYLTVDNNNNTVGIFAGSLYIPGGATAGYVLTSDASGIASWAPASGGGSSPYSVVNSTSIFSTGLVGTGSGSIAIESFMTGTNAGNGATNADNSNFLGQNAGKSATAALGSNFLGLNAGNSATNAAYSNFLGYHAGDGATNASGSNFFGFNAGFGATGASDSFFMGNSAGYLATGSSNSVFIGAGSGNTTTLANYSTFVGDSSGYQATNAQFSSFIGSSAGYQASSAANSNFFGTAAGQGATNADHSVFLGDSVGVSATNANQSIFIGSNTGTSATNASNAIFIGQSAGFGDTVNNTGNPDDGSIIIGAYANTGGFSNSVVLGSGTSATSINNTKANQFLLSPNLLYTQWRGIDYEFPSAQAAGAGYVLSNNGSGVLSWVPGGGGSGTVTSITAGTNLTGGTITTSGTINLDTTLTGLTSVSSTTFVGALTGTASGNELPLTFSTGLTRATNTITSNLSTGISGGQSVIGGTASGNNLTLSSTSNATKGKINFGTSNYDEALNQLNITNSSQDTWVTATGNINSSFQANIQNTNSGASASGDFVITANNGTSTTHYLDLGMNSSGGGLSPFTTANETYLYSIDDTLNFGALGASSQIKFFTTGGTSPVQRAVIDNAGFFGINETTPTAFLQITRNSIGSTLSDAYGILLKNGTAAAAGAQQESPAIVFAGNGWKTTATAASQDVRFRLSTTPVQGTTAPTGLFTLENSINAGAYTTANTFSSIGTIGFGANSGMGIGSTLANTTFSSGGGGMLLQAAVGSTTNLNNFTFQSANARTTTSGEASGIMNMVSFAPTSGTAVFNGYTLNMTVNQTGVTGSPITRGIYINPTLTSASDFRALEITAGKMQLPSTVTATGTTGNQTINKMTGTVNVAAAGTTITVTNSLVGTSSIISVTARTNDATCSVKNYVPASGSFVINMTAACTAETSVGFMVVN